MSTSCQTGSQVIRAFSDVEKPFLFSDLSAFDIEKPCFFPDLAVKAAKSVKKSFQRQRRLGLAAGSISFIDTAAGGIATSLLIHHHVFRHFHKVNSL